MTLIRTGALAGWTHTSDGTIARYDGLHISVGQKAQPDGNDWAIVPSQAWTAALSHFPNSPLFSLGFFSTPREAGAVADHKLPPRECYACNALATGIRTSPEVIDAEIVPPAKPTEDVGTTIDGKRWAFACELHCDVAPSLAPAPETAPGEPQKFIADWIDSKGKIVASGLGSTQEEAERFAATAFEPTRKKRIGETFSQRVGRVSARTGRKS